MRFGQRESSVSRRLHQCANMEKFDRIVSEGDEEMLNGSKLGLSGLPKGFLDQEIHYPIVTIWFPQAISDKNRRGASVRISRYQLCNVVQYESTSSYVYGPEHQIVYSEYPLPSHTSMRLSFALDRGCTDLDGGWRLRQRPVHVICPWHCRLISDGPPVSTPTSATNR